jgi:hypothetical protein
MDTHKRRFAMSHVTDAGAQRRMERVIATLEKSMKQRRAG